MIKLGITPRMHLLEIGKHFFTISCHAKIMNRAGHIFRKQSTVKLGDKERFDKGQIGVKEPFPVTKSQFTS